MTDTAGRVRVPNGLVHRLARLRERVAATGAWQPPIRRPEFWAVQGLVLVIAGGHAYLETHALDHGPTYFLPVSLFFLPVVYAAVSFGIKGSGATAVWCAVLTSPNILFWHKGPEQIGEFWQVATVVAIGVFVGNRVDRETRARRDAEGRAQAHRAAEARYRGLFDHVADAILLLAPTGRVEEANEAASQILAPEGGSLVGQQIESLVGPELGTMLSGHAPPRVSRLGSAAAPRWVEPVATPFTDPSGSQRTQVVLRDVTLRYERERALEVYTRQTITAREEERRRIARDLHDGPVQSLVLLVRKLDRVEQSATPERAGLVGQARSIAEEVANDLRRFSRELRPSVLDDLGLVAALKAEADILAQRSALSIDVRTFGNAHRLPPELEVTFLRVEQEALHNVERHALATRARVLLSFRTGVVRMAIEDDGRGLGSLSDSSELVASGKLGIIGMQERARLSGASLRLGRSRLGGALVELVSHS